MTECEVCGFNAPIAIEDHHLIPRRFGGTDEPKNVVEVCANCHRALEGLYDNNFWGRVARNQTGDEDWVIVQSETG